MTTTFFAPSTSVAPRLTEEEVAELTALTHDLPQLVRGGWTAPLPVGTQEAVLRLDAAMWEVARTHGVEVCTECGLLDVIDRLAAQGWDGGPARDALRAFVMLRAAGTTDDLAAVHAAARLISYLELRARFG